MTSSQAIAVWWQWWPSVADEVAALADTPEPEETTAMQRLRLELDRRVREISPELSWHVGDGLLARHSFVVSPEGSPSLRVVTERWRRAGPADSETWEFHAARPPNPQAMHTDVDAAGRMLTPLKARFGAETDDARGRVHVVVQHPQMPLLDSSEQLWFAFLLLDWILGEDDVERWVGDVRVVKDPQPYDGSALRRQVDEFARELRSSAHWAHLEGIDAVGRRNTVEVRLPIARYDFPLFDVHCALTIPLVRTPHAPEDEVVALAIDPPEPDPEEIAEVEKLTHALLDTMGGSVHLAAVETWSNRRVVHLYVDSAGTARSEMATWLQGQARPGVKAVWSADAGWEKVRVFLENAVELPPDSE